MKFLGGKRVEISIGLNTIIQLASLLTASGVIGGAIVWCVHFIERQKRQDKEIASIRKEQTLICYGVLACLKGLKEQGCDGPVTEAQSKIEKYLNQAAHEEE